LGKFGKNKGKGKMKGKITKKENAFEPFILEIEVEDENDLKDLWCRFNIVGESIRKSKENECYPTINNYKPTHYHRIWTTLNNKMKELGLG
jgi:hypothetical protein